MYKIYINEKPVILCSEEEFPNIENKSYFTNYEPNALIFNNEFLQKLNIENGIICISQNNEDTFNKFTKDLKLMEAAGGLVLTNERDKALFIFRRNKWDLPKGKIDEGESIKKAAWREVAEECGISTHKIEEHLTDTFHIYQYKEKWILKKTYWYLMSAEEENLIPQLEEDITKAEWIPIADVIETIKNETYPMIIEILNFE